MEPLKRVTTNKLHITHISDPEYIGQKQSVYTGAFMSLYKQVELSKDPCFVSDFKNKWDLNDIEYRSIESDVLAVRKSKDAHDKEIIERIECIENALGNDEIDDEHKAFKLRCKLSRLKNTVDGECCFGKISLLRKISREYNKSEEKRDYDKISDLLGKWKESRKRGITVMGEANQKCNRFFDLTRINEGIIIYKQDKKHKVKIKFNTRRYRNWKPIFDRIAELSGFKQNDPDCNLSVSVCLTQSDITLTYDEEILNGYGVDTKSRRKEAKEIKSKNLPKEVEKEQIKEIYRKYYRQQEELKLEGKLLNRVIATDMNPDYFSYAVIDMNDEDGSYKVIKTGYFDLSSINRKRRFRPGSNAYKYIHNKRHYEIDCIVKKVFNIARHYRCSKFIIEDLDFKHDDTAVNNSEFNRQTKSVWCREQITKRITRRCNETDITLEKICAVYSSFIGNIQHEYIDPCNAAIEIARRGALKYKKGSFYPILSSKDRSTLGTLFGDGPGMTAGGWREIYQFAKSLFEKQRDFSYRWRKHKGDVSVRHRYRTCSMNSCKSRVRHVVFL